MAQIPIENLESVESVINYTEDSDYRPAFYIDRPVSGIETSARVSEKHTVPIYDIRTQMDNASLDGNGFCFIHNSLPQLDFFDPDTVKTNYYPMCAEYVQRATGAARVMAFDHNVRDKDLTDQAGVNFPVRFAHNDYTEKSGPQRVHDLMGDEASALLERRYLFINVWRPLRGPVLDTPLAVCDAASLDTQDFIATDLIYHDRTGEIFSFRFSKSHRWVFLRNMRADEILLLKCFDSATDGRARYTAHSAFRDPRAAADVPVRRSIEVRTIAFF